MCSGSNDGKPRSLPICVSWPDFKSRNHITQFSTSSAASPSFPLRQNISPDPSGALIVAGDRSCASATASTAVTLWCSVRSALSGIAAGEADSCCGGVGEDDGPSSSPPLLKAGELFATEYQSGAASSFFSFVPRGSVLQNSRVSFGFSRL